MTHFMGVQIVPTTLLPPSWRPFHASVQRLAPQRKYAPRNWYRKSAPDAFMIGSKLYVDPSEAVRLAATVEEEA